MSTLSLISDRTLHYLAGFSQMVDRSDWQYVISPYARNSWECFKDSKADNIDGSKSQEFTKGNGATAHAATRTNCA